KKESLLDRWKNRETKDSTTNSIKKAPSGIKIPLSSGQKRLWFLQQMYPNNPFYNYSETYTFDGPLNEEHLILSLNKVYQDHDVLRSTYHIEDKTIFQNVDTSSEMEISIHNLSTLSEKDKSLKLQEIIDSDATKHFNLNKGPLVRVTLIKISNTKHILQITLHHIVTDKWSMRIFREHLATYYRQLNKNIQTTKLRGELQYSDYSFWSEKKEINTKHLEYWKYKLSGEIPNLILPTDYPRPLRPSFKGAASYTQVFDKILSNKLLNLSKQLETTPYNLMLSVYYVLLFKYSGQTDILIGTPITNRDQKNLEELIGFFNDTVVLRTKLSPSMSFIDLVKAVHNNTLDAFANKDIPFDILVKELKVERSTAINPFFQVMFLYHSVSENPVFDDNLNLTHTWFDTKVSKFDLTIYISEINGILSSTFEYATDLFEEATINRFQKYFKQLLEEVVSNPNENIIDISIINQAEKQFLINQDTQNFNSFSEDNSIQNIIERTCKMYPDAIAVTFQNSSITYKELNNRATLLANKLLENLKAKNEVVALCVDRSIDMIIGILGILKAGCAYLPIDPEYPSERIHFMIKDSGVNIVLTQKTSVINYEIQSIFIEDVINNKNEIAVKNYPETSKTDLAYIIYTSGSTGQPKGVPITHESLINSTAGRLEYYDNNPSAFLLLSSISFDSSIAGIFWTLCTGGNLVIAEKRIEQDIDRIGNIINEKNISHTLMLPSLYKLILEYINKDKLLSLNTVIVAGEACTRPLCKIHFEKIPHTKLYNEYGPTEATVWCIAHEIKKTDNFALSVPIGKPVAGANIYLFDNHLKLVPYGAIGEIYIGGHVLSKGYFNKSDLTNKVFIDNPFNKKGKLYKTGDLGRYRNDGNIEFLGRADEQIKIRGYRVELGEIVKKIKTYGNSIDEVIVLYEEESATDNYQNSEKYMTIDEMAQVLSNIDENEVSNIIDSIKSLSNSEKEYLLSETEEKHSYEKN
uniref:non-ribosomal peptide synthetase n=1 Tax=uncultured Algibacter sp. TaxID=298659 RepID=UPI00262FB52B